MVYLLSPALECNSETKMLRLELLIIQIVSAVKCEAFFTLRERQRAKQEGFLFQEENVIHTYRATVAKRNKKSQPIGMRQFSEVIRAISQFCKIIRH